MPREKRKSPEADSAGHAKSGESEEVRHLYQIVLKALQSEIVRGIYPVGTPLPSESVLVDRFRVSRHTVRAALRSLRESGLVRSHQGLGTIVQRPGGGGGYVHQINTISDLFPVNVETRYDAAVEPVAPLPEWASTRLGLSDNRGWLPIRALRYRSEQDAPFNEVDTFVSSRFAGVGRVISTHSGAIYNLVEAIYGETISEVEQTIVGTHAEGELGRRIGLEPGEPCVEVRRIYRIASDHDIALLSFNRYRVEDFSFSMTVRRVKE